MEVKTKVPTKEQWKKIQENLEGWLANESFMYKGHKVTVQRQRESESKSILAVFIDGTIAGKWITFGLDSLKDREKEADRPAIIDDVWMLRSRARHKASFIKSMEKIYGKRRAVKEWPDLHGRTEYRYPYFNKASTLVRQFQKLDGIEWIEGAEL